LSAAYRQFFHVLTWHRVGPEPKRGWDFQSPDVLEWIDAGRHCVRSTELLLLAGMALQGTQ
jgi:hypothetical protein